MEKPISVRVQEFEVKMVELINESHLSSYILKVELEKLYNVINQQELQEIQQYNETLDKEDDIDVQDK